MGSMNLTRVVLGGLVAGLVINVGEALLNTGVLAARMEAEFARLNLPPMSGGVIAVFVALCFLLGITVTWIYAAIRPRFGAGPGTAMRAGVAIWVAAYLFPGVGQIAMGLFSAPVVALSLLWGLAEVLLAAIAGAYVYQERGSGSRHTVSV